MSGPRCGKQLNHRTFFSLGCGPFARPFAPCLLGYPPMEEILDARANDVEGQLRGAVPSFTEREEG